jgi:DNA-binding MarR family transcriptional regulator
MYDQYLRPTGIRSTQYGMLRCVSELPDSFISDIGRVLCMDQTTVTRNVEKLEKAGLVQTRPHPEDPRKKQVELSPLGKAKLAEAHLAWEEAQNRIVGRMGEDDFENFLKLLNKLMQVAHK